MRPMSRARLIWESYIYKVNKWFLILLLIGIFYIINPNPNFTPFWTTQRSHRNWRAYLGPGCSAYHQRTSHQPRPRNPLCFRSYEESVPKVFRFRTFAAPVPAVSVDSPGCISWSEASTTQFRYYRRTDWHGTFGCSLKILPHRTEDPLQIFSWSPTPYCHTAILISSSSWMSPIATWYGNYCRPRHSRCTWSPSTGIS